MYPFGRITKPNSQIMYAEEFYQAMKYKWISQEMYAYFIQSYC